MCSFHSPNSPLNSRRIPWKIWLCLPCYHSSRRVWGEQWTNCNRIHWPRRSLFVKLTNLCTSCVNVLFATRRAMPHLDSSHAPDAPWNRSRWGGGGSTLLLPQDHSTGGDLRERHSGLWEEGPFMTFHVISRFFSRHIPWITPKDYDQQTIPKKRFSTTGFWGCFSGEATVVQCLNYGAWDLGAWGRSS